MGREKELMIGHMGGGGGGGGGGHMAAAMIQVVCNENSPIHDIHSHSAV